MRPSPFRNTPSSTPFRFRSRTIMLALSLATLQSTFAPAIARANDWTNTLGGTFGVSTNWNGGAPGTTGTANFNLPNTYTVSFSAAPTNLLFTQSAGNLTLIDGNSAPRT